MPVTVCNQNKWQHVMNWENKRWPKRLFITKYRSLEPSLKGYMCVIAFLFVMCNISNKTSMDNIYPPKGWEATLRLFYHKTLVNHTVWEPALYLRGDESFQNWLCTGDEKSCSKHGEWNYRKGVILNRGTTCCGTVVD